MSGKLNGIFARVLIAAVGPLLVACFLLMGGINGIVRGEAEDLAEEAARHLGAQISVRVGDMLSIMVGALDLTRRNLEFLDPGAPDAQAFAGHILRAAIDANPSVYAAWFSFERGAFSSSGRFWRGYVRERDGIASMPAPPDSQLDDRRLSPWYNRPFSSGTGYFQGTNQYYDTGGHFYTGALVFPVKRGDRVIGCVGIDIRYDTLLKFLRGGGNKRAITLLTMGDEELYTTREDADDFTGSTPRDFLSDALDEENFASYYTKGAKSGKEHYVCLVPLVFGTEAAGIETPRTGLALRIETPTAYLQGLAADVGKGIIALGVIVLLSVVGVLFPVTLDITRPLEEITAKADAVAAGGQDIGFEENAHTAAINEVARLRSSLKKMMDGLGQVNALKMAAMTAEFERGRLKAETVAKTQFFASMSHEIRTPMNAITGLSELLLREKLSEPQQEKVRSIKTSCAGLLRTVSDLLDFSNMESGKFELHPAHYSFPQCIDRITSLVDMLARDKGLAFIVETRGHIPRCLFGDAGRLSQLLANILENAVKYTDSGFVRLTVAVEGETLAYTVEDSGAGIKDTVLPYIFDPYSHFGDDTMKQIAGTGLGLSIAKRLALMMGGDIAVSSVAGKGSVFVVRLPLVPGDLEILERDIRETPVSRTWQARALVVDDHPVNLNVAKGLLSLYGLDCDTALSGAEALIRARQQEYDIIFMDHMMPEMDGVEATAAIRALGGRYAVLPVIALTANIIPGAKEALLASGLNDYLPKPVELPALRAILSRWLPPDREGGAPGYGNSAVGGAIPRGETGALIQSAREIAGLDVTTGLSRVCGLEDVFLKSLRLCAESLCQPLARLPGLAAAWDTAALCREMHGLKGSLANIGAMDLAEEAVALEDAARNMNADYYAGRFTDFHRRLGGFAGELRALFFGAAGVRPPGDAGMREDKETELAAALEAYDSDAALAILEELGAFSFGPEHDARLAAVKSRVERFSYDEALETLTRPQGLAPEEGER